MTGWFPVSASPAGVVGIDPGAEAKAPPKPEFYVTRAGLAAQPSCRGRSGFGEQQLSCGMPAEFWVNWPAGCKRTPRKKALCAMHARAWAKRHKVAMP